MAFTHAGMYNGNSLSKTYYNVLEDATYNVTMGITSQMNPKNGVIEGCMVENFENNTPCVYIYSDEDWRKPKKFTTLISLLFRLVCVSSLFVVFVRFP